MNCYEFFNVYVFSFKDYVFIYFYFSQYFLQYFFNFYCMVNGFYLKFLLFDKNINGVFNCIYLLKVVFCYELYFEQIYDRGFFSRKVVCGVIVVQCLY